jgi:general secretion pathway protein G
VKTRGFTLIELLVTLAILGILAAAVMPLGETAIVAAKERELRRNLWELRDAIDAYKQASDGFGLTKDGSGYPPSLEALVKGLADPRAHAGAARVYFLRQVPRDPFGHPRLPAEQTWRLRSFASPPEQPEPGADVYDVKSSSSGTALDGSAYASW